MEPECFTGFNTLSKKKKNKNNIRRFSDEQIRLLETMFESETKLEPRKKIQLARELGLQPRQVAIWFQNKRARWKSKQLERDYGILRSNYNTLASKFEALKKEKQSLLVQLQKLNDVVDKSKEESKGCMKETAENNNMSIPNNGDVKNEPKVTPIPNMGRSEYGIAIQSDEDSSIKTEYFGVNEEEPELLNMMEPVDGSLTSSENWESLDSDRFYDQSSNGSYQWWDFWS